MIIWEIRAKILFPMTLMGTSIDGNPPQTLQLGSRYIENQKIILGEFALYIAKIEYDENQRKFNGETTFEPVHLICETRNDSATKALDESLQHIEWCCDQLSYFSQEPINIESIDVRPKNKEENISSYLANRQPAKSRKSSFTNTEISTKIPLSIPPDNFSEYDFALLRWYHKALSAPSDMDRFIFLWVCLEILCKSISYGIKEPYKTHCGHEISKCPTCESSIEKELNGTTLKTF